jgi:hypothetical protein
VHTAGQALIWELWRISRWDLILRALGWSVLWVAIFCFLETGRDGLEPIAGSTLLMLLGTSMYSGAWMQTFENRRTGFCFPLGYSQPISTRVLVAVPMAYIACTSVLSFWIPAALLRLLFGIPFPLLPTATLIVTVSALRRAAVVSVGLWTVFVAATVTLYLKAVPVTVTVPISALALGLGMMTTPLTAAAIAPLALASHRRQ